MIVLFRGSRQCRKLESTELDQPKSRFREALAAVGILGGDERASCGDVNLLFCCTVSFLRNNYVASPLKSIDDQIQLTELPLDETRPTSRINAAGSDQYFLYLRSLQYCTVSVGITGIWDGNALIKSMRYVNVKLLTVIRNEACPASS